MHLLLLPFHLLSLYLFFLAHALAWNALLLAAIWLFRRRVPELAAKIATALTFCGATAWLLWKMEWFDVWRHGVPPVSYLITGYVPWLATVGTGGWFLAALVMQPRAGGRRLRGQSHQATARRT
jgi:hypothetical protein